MAQSKIRSLVNSVVHAPACGTSDGEFVDESIRSFYKEMKQLVDTGFRALYDEVHSVPNKDATWRAEAMARGLAYLGNPQNEQAIVESIAEVEETGRSLARQYFLAMPVFVREVNPSILRRDIMHTNYISVGSFIARLYRKIAVLPVIQNNQYFTTMSPAERDCTVREVVRQVMYSAIVWPNTHLSTPIQPSDSISNIIQAGDGDNSAKRRGSVASSASVVPTPPSASVVPSVAHRSRSATDVRSTVADAVPRSIVGSQIGNFVARSVVSSMRNNNKSQFTTFTTPSVITRSTDTKVVHLDSR